MRNFAAILLCFAFVATQYAKQAAYLECRLLLYFNTGVSPCDCEKLLPSGDQKNSIPLSSPHSHWHPDDWYYPVRIKHQQVQNLFDGCNHFRTAPVKLQEGYPWPPEHPPRLS